jgi:muramidase (phage lysozyme)
MATIPIDAKIAAFLDLIAWSEGTSISPVSKNDGYDVIVSGVDGRHTFNDYGFHPFAHGRAPIVVRASTPPLLSTASGRYQIILPTWLSLSRQYMLPSFLPMNQDSAAIALLSKHYAINYIMTGELQVAFALASCIWASFPSSHANQPTHTPANLLSVYTSLLATQDVKL